MTYDPVAYWQRRGETYAARFRPERYREQEDALRAVLSELTFETVLDVGCGFGRMRGLVDAEYTGIDLSETMIAGQPDLIHSSLEDFHPGKRYDLVMAVEMLMHVPPVDVERAVRKLHRLSSRYIVTLDWTTPVPHPESHNFIHDYAGLHRDPLEFKVGLQSIFLVDKRWRS